uniref:Uncharacterized protein n=1 Tax=Streptomyces avermitilis TaxID=33903 RepID=A0A499VHV3_STRAX|nr:hypothetical protein SAVMC3_66840 [Streptomyces avermitilis]
MVSHSFQFVPMFTLRLMSAVCWKFPELWPGSMTTTLPRSGPEAAGPEVGEAGVEDDVPGFSPSSVAEAAGDPEPPAEDDDADDFFDAEADVVPPAALSEPSPPPGAPTAS